MAKFSFDEFVQRGVRARGSVDAELAKVRAIAQRGAEESALTEARAAQDRFWRALKRLELILGVDVDQTLDLRDYDCETLIERAEEE